MNITRDSLNIAVVQAESIMFDKDKCIEKAIGTTSLGLRRCEPMLFYKVGNIA